MTIRHHNWYQRLRITADELLTKVRHEIADEIGSVKHGETTARGRQRALQLGSLEPRLLFSATPIDPALIDGGNEAATVMTVEADNQEDSEAATTISEQQSQVSELVIIDSLVPGLQALLDDLSQTRPDATVVVLDSDRDGVTQITEILDSHRDLSSVHIVSHAEDSAVRLGSVWLRAENLSGYAGEMAKWQSALSADADILFYGCDLAADESGRELLDSIATLTGADVAASDDDTGHAKYNADWDFEYSFGVIETEVAFSESLQNDWFGKLATTTVDVFDDQDDSNSETSLREAIRDANAGDTILLRAGTYDVKHDLILINKDLTIEGADARSTIINRSHGSQRLFHFEDNAVVNLSGVTLQGGNENNGGAIFVDNNSTLNLSDAVLQNNSSDRGGAIHVRGTANIERVLLFNNSSTIDGGAITFLNSNGGSLTNVTISGNSTTGDGGGLWTNSTISIVNSTIADNTAVEGGGIRNFNGSVTLSNTIVVSNTGTDTNNDVAGTFISNGKNIIEDLGSASGLGSDILGDDAGLLTLANNGGSIDTHAFLSTSSAFNGGATISGVSADSRGYQRDTQTDIGAFELGWAGDVWFSTSESASSPSGAPGLDSWDEGEALSLGGASLSLGSGSTNGVLSSKFNLDSLSDDGDARLSGIHFVGRDTRVGGANSIDLKQGDILFATGNESFMSGALTVGDNDIVLFRPDVANDYSSGTFSVLLENFSGGAIQSISLVEKTTIVGDRVIEAGDFLYSRFTFSGQNDVYVYETADVGVGTTNGNQIKLMEGTQLGLGSTSLILGIDLVETRTTIGGQTLEAGTLLLQATNNHNNVGDNDISTNSHDIIAFEVTTTTQIGGTASANASILFRGEEVSSDAGGIWLDAFSLGYSITTFDPIAEAGGAYTLTEGNSLSLDASASSAPGGSVVSYQWDLDHDGDFSDLITASATTTIGWSDLVNQWGIDDGSIIGTDYTVGLRVVDNQGLTNDTTTTVTVSDLAPTIVATGAATSENGSAFTLSLSATDPGDDAITGWIVNWGDGAVTTHAAVSTANHTYDGSTGLVYNITVAAINEDGTFHGSNGFATSSAANPADGVYRIEPTTGDYVPSSAFGGSVINDPVEAVIGPDGNLYVGSYGGSRIDRFDPDTGNHLGAFVNDVNLDGVVGFAWGFDGNLYVASYHSDEIHRYDGTTGARLDAGNAAFISGLDGPADLLFHTDGNLYVSNYSGGTVQRFNAETGVAIADPGGFFIGSGILDGAESFAFGTDGNLYIASELNDSVFRFDASGNPVDGGAAYISGNGLKEPIGLTFGPDGLLYIGSAGSDQIRRYDTSGATATFVDNYVDDANITQNRHIVFQPNHQVRIVDANFAPTNITLSSNSIDENIDTSGGFSVGTLQTTDTNAGDTFTYEVVGGADQGEFAIGGLAGDELLLNDGILDYESKTSYQVQVRVTDSGNVQFEKLFTIEVNDQNDVTPVITTSQTFGILEDAVDSTTVGMVTATDPDTIGSLRDWTITDGNDLGIFALDTTSGVLTIANSSNLNYEANTSHILTVRVSDGSNTSATQTVTVNVSDVNDVAPVITPGQNFSVSEAALDDTIFGTVNGSDADTVGSLQNWMITGGNTEGVFQINSTNGEISIADNTTLDFESRASYTLSLQVSDGVTNSANESIRIDISDVAEVNAIWISTSDNVTTSGNPDLAQWENDQVIQLGDPGLNFEPNGGTTSGELSLTGFKLSNFHSSAQARIEGMHAVWSDLTIGSGATQFDLKQGDLLLTVAGNGVTLSSQTEPDKTFNQNDIFVFRPTDLDDYSTGDFFHLLDDPLGATRLRGVSLVETPAGLVVGDTTLAQGTLLLVRDGNDEDDRVYTFTADTIGEGTTSGTQQILLEGSTDDEPSTSGNLRFSNRIDGIHIVNSTRTIGGTTLQAGDLLLTTYNVTSIAGVDVEDQDITRLRMTTTRIGNDFSSGTAELFLDASDIQFEESSTAEDIDALTLVEGAQTNYAIGPITDTNVSGNQVSESASIGTTVGITAAATDLDPGDSVTYGLDTDPAGLFEIDANSGEVTVADSLDFESASSHEIVVRATSSDTSFRTLAFTIFVSNENDVATGTPQIQGSALVGETLTLDTSSIADQDGLGSFQYQWFRSGTLMSWATNDTYTLTVDDEGETIRAAIRFVDGQSNSEGPLSSAATDVVLRGNTAPTLQDHRIQVVSGREKTFDSSVFESLAQDIDSDDLTAVLVSGPASGTLVLSTDGGFSFKSEDDFEGTLSFEWLANDGSLDSNTAVMEIVVRPRRVVVPILPPAASRTEGPNDDAPEDSPEDSDPNDETTENEDTTADTETEKKENDSSFAAKTKPNDVTPDTQPETSATKATPIALQQGFVGVEQKAQQDKQDASNVAGRASNHQQSDRQRNQSRLPDTGESSDITRIDNEGQGLAWEDMVALTRPGEMWDDFDRRRDDVEAQIQGDMIVVGSAGAAASSMTVGVVAWAMRSGFLVSGLIAHMPAWSGVDPLMIMQGMSAEGIGGDQETLEELMDRQSKAMDSEETEL